MGKVDMIQHRESQQQELIEKFQLAFYDLVEKCEDKASSDQEIHQHPLLANSLARDILSTLSRRRVGLAIDPEMDKAHSGRLLLKLWPEIEAFANVEEEKDYLLFQLLEKLMGSIGRGANSAYHSRALKEPKKVYKLKESVPV